MKKTETGDVPLAQVLVVEDDPDLREAMESYLQTEAMRVDGVGSIADANRQLSKQRFDVLVLDLGLPDGDGLAWLEQTPQLQDMGLIIMTARGQVDQRLAGLRAKADAYLVKPVPLEELTLHIRNLFTRMRSAPINPPSSDRHWQLHRKRWVLTAPNGLEISLNQTETRLLAALATGSGNAMNKGDLLPSLGYSAHNYDDRRLEALVRRLRGKCKEKLGQTLPLQTAYGQGYAFTEELEIVQ